MRLKTVLLSGYFYSVCVCVCVSYVQHRLETQEDIWKRRKVPKVPQVPGFSPFVGKSLGAFRPFPNAIFLLFVPCFRVWVRSFRRKAFSPAYGSKLYFFIIPLLQCVIFTTSTGHTGDFAKGEKCRKCRNFRHFGGNP